MVNEVAELKNCNNVIFFESRKHKDLYMWVGRTPNGPSCKFLVQNGMLPPSLHLWLQSPDLNRFVLSVCSTHNGRSQTNRELSKG